MNTYMLRMASAKGSAFLVCLVALVLTMTGMVGQEQTVIKGTVLDGESQLPLAGAHVFLAGSTIGDVTDADGSFLLSPVPPGVLEFVVSMVGYERYRQPLQPLLGVNEMNLRVVLTPQVMMLDEVVVTALTSETISRYRERFTNQFLGWSDNAQSSKILNPEVLSFSPNEAVGGFDAFAEQPLLIVNERQGYRIVYYLEHFSEQGDLLEYFGYSFFEALEPKNTRQASRWKHRRAEAYSGSIQHFLTVLQQAGSVNELIEAGFLVYSAEEPVSRPDPAQLMRPDQLVEKESDQMARLIFDKSIWVLYTKEEEDFIYRRNFKPFRINSRGQTSRLRLRHDSVYVDAQGSLYDPYSVLVSGYWGYERVADQTPLNHTEGPL